MELNELIATADFHVSGTTTDGDVYDNATVHVELHDSGAYDGNRTCVIMKIPHQMTEYFDTRYDRSLKSDGSNFREWARQMLIDYVADGFVVTD